MRTSQTVSMHRTGTMPVSLPKITKLSIKQARYNNNDISNRSSFHIHTSRAKHNNIQTSRSKHTHSFIQSKSPFTTRVQQQVIDQQQYPYIQTSNIQKQQTRLKQLLKSFNQQTVNILQKYVISKPIKKQYIKKKPPVEEIHYVREKQGQNSMNMILLMKKQIEKLQSRCQDLKYISKEEFQYKIRQLKQEKGKIIAENKEISREITLNGLQMVRGKQSHVKQLQYEQFLISSKRQKLKRQSQTVQKQINQLQQKTKQIITQIDNYQHTQSYTLKQYEQIQRQKSQNKLYEQYMMRKKQYEHMKVITQSANYQLKHKYFQKLKLLDESASINDSLEDKHTQILAHIDNTLANIKQLQTKYSLIIQKTKLSKMLTTKINNSNSNQQNNNNTKTNNILFNTQPATSYLN